MPTTAAAMDAMTASMYSTPTPNQGRQRQPERLTSVLLPWRPQYEIYKQEAMRVSIDLLINLYLKGHLSGIAKTYVQHGVIIAEQSLHTILPDALADSLPSQALAHSRLAEYGWLLVHLTAQATFGNQSAAYAQPYHVC